MTLVCRVHVSLRRITLQGGKTTHLCGGFPCLPLLQYTVAYYLTWYVIITYHARLSSVCRYYVTNVHVCFCLLSSLYTTKLHELMYNYF